LATSSALLMGFGFSVIAFNDYPHPEYSVSGNCEVQNRTVTHNATGSNGTEITTYQAIEHFGISYYNYLTRTIWDLPTAYTLTWYFETQVAYLAFQLTAAGFCISFNLISLFIATTAIMCGPGMALRGPEGSLSITVPLLEEQLKRGTAPATLTRPRILALTRSRAHPRTRPSARGAAHARYSTDALRSERMCISAHRSLGTSRSPLL
jgi:hypothetical protein